jgi:glycosyltransferase involved in cell wall biosynthesis
MKAKVYCVIPAYNEKNKIAKVVDSVSDLVYKVVVVDDGSSDGSVNFPLKKNVVVLRHLINRGQGAALMTGNRYSIKDGAEIIVHFDGDGQFRAKDIEVLTKPIIENKAEAVFGSRFLSKKSNLPAIKRFLIHPMARLVNFCLLGINLSDPQSGFRAFNRRVAEELEINNDGAAHCSEIMHKISKITDKIKEVPIIVNYDNFGQGIFKGKGRGTGGIKIIKDLIIQKIID